MEQDTRMNTSTSIAVKPAFPASNHPGLTFRELAAIEIAAGLCAGDRSPLAYDRDNEAAARERLVRETVRIVDALAAELARPRA